MDPPDESEKSIDDVYHDRNLLAIAFATVVEMARGSSGFYYDNDWPVIWVETPAGQTSWHIHPDLEDVLKRSTLQERPPSDGWDGHDRVTKNSRLARYITGQYPTFP